MRCVEKYFIEIMQVIGENKETLGKFFENLVLANFTVNTCNLIRLLAESCRVNLLYDQLFSIFHSVIIPLLVPKLRVDRAFVESLPLAEFFFYGFGNLPFEFPESLCDDFEELLEIRVGSVEKDPRNPKKRDYLKNYLDFMEGVIFLYIDYYKNNDWCNKFIQQMGKVRKDFNWTLSQFEIKELCEKA